jgi:cell division protein YceG involved in septum cleavage
MELMAMIAELLPTLGFPIICVIGLGWFIYKIYNDTTKANAENMEKVQARCQEREDKLYEQLEKQNIINGRFAEIIAQYEVKLDTIQLDISDIKTDIAVIKNK